MSELIGVIALLSSISLAVLCPVIYKKASGNLINSLMLSTLSMILFSGVYLAYTYYNNPESYKIDKTKPNPFGLTDNPFANSVLPSVLLLSVLAQLRFTTLYMGHIFLPVSVSIPLAGLSIFSVIFFSHFLRGQKINNNQIIASIFVIIGAIVINLNKILNNSKEMRNIKNSHYLFGLISLTIATILSGYVITKLKIMSEVASPMAIMFNEGVGAFLLILTCGIIYFFISKKTLQKLFGIKKSVPTLKNAVLFFFASLFIFNFATLTRFIAIKNLNEVKVSIITKLKVILALFVGAYFFKEHISKEKIIGAVIMLVAVFMVIIHSHKKDISKHNIDRY